jgi:hypothetical protein
LFIDSTDTISVKNSSGTVVPVGALPSQSGNAGKVLGTDGSTASWTAPASGLPDQTGNSRSLLTTDGTTASWTPGVKASPYDGTLYFDGNGKFVGTNGFTRLYVSSDTSLRLYSGSDAVAIGPNYNVWGVSSDAVILMSDGPGTCGTATLSGGAATISCPLLDATTVVQLTIQDPNGATPGVLYISSKTVGTGFVITSTNSSDTCSVFWNIIRVGGF